MSWIKITISALTLSASPLLFGQLTQSGNSFEKLNSATAGLFYKHEGNLTARAIGGSGFYNLATFANYSTVSKNGKYGFGINHFGINRSFLSNTLSVNLAKLNVNRQFVLKNGDRLSAGIGVGGINERFRGPDVIGVPNSSSVMTDLSVAYSSKRFKAGASLIGIFNDGGTAVNGNFFASYTFGNEEKLQFTPHVFIGIPNNNFGGTFAYKSKFFLGGGVKDYSTWTPYAKAGFRLNNKIQFNYSVDFNNPSAPVTNQPLRHEFGLAIQLGKR